MIGLSVGREAWTDFVALGPLASGGCDMLRGGITIHGVVMVAIFERGKLWQR
jgi:hypothetical protein